MIIYLNNNFQKCPPFWQKYVRSLPSKSDVFVTHKCIDRDLKKYGAIYIENLENEPMLKFNSEQDAMRFVLNWS